MESWWILIVLAFLMVIVPVLNQQYSANTGKPSLNREIFVRAWMTGVMAFGIAITTHELVAALLFFFPMSIALSIFAAMSYPTREKAYRAMYEQKQKRKS
ncbi:MAG: hypothetical protein HY868_23090 [Chloroflexi bacterium]|nr:hypothetical protein [Chloroflexota bacterium]